MHLLKSRLIPVVTIGLTLLFLLTSTAAVPSYAAPLILRTLGTKPIVPPIRDDNFGGGGTLLLPTIRHVGETKYVNYVLMDASGKNEKPLWDDYDTMSTNFFASFVGDKGDIVFSGSTANDDRVGPYNNQKLELYLTNLNGTKPEKLQDADNAQNWIASPDGKYLALNILYDDNAGLNVYDLEARKRIRILPTKPDDTIGPALPLFFTPDSKKLVFQDKVSITYQIYDLTEKTIKPVTTDETLAALGTLGVAFPIGVSVNTSGEIASCEITDNNKISIFTRNDWLAKPKELLEIAPQKSPCMTIRWSPDEKYILYGGWGGGSTPFENRFFALSVADGKTTLLREMEFTGQSYYQVADWSPLSR